MQMKSSKSWRKRVSIEKRDRKAMFNLFADFEGSGQLESTSWMYVFMHGVRICMKLRSKKNESEGIFLLSFVRISVIKVVN